jgi:hypothetical protein
MEVPYVRHVITVFVLFNLVQGPDKELIQSKNMWPKSTERVMVWLMVYPILLSK